MAYELDIARMESALTALGDELTSIGHPEVEALVVGGAAGMLSNLLGPRRQTDDCDIAFYAPSTARVRVETAAIRVAQRLGLKSEWFNSRVMLWSDAFPPLLVARRTPFRTYGPLKLSIMHREDLVAMKILASREEDIADLDELRPTADELEYAHDWLESLPRRDPNCVAEDLVRALRTLEVYRDRIGGQ